MKKLFLLSVGLLLASCASSSQIEKTLENNPDIIFRAIEKNPVKFAEAANKAMMAAQNASQEETERESEKRMEEQFKNPLKPVISGDRAFKGPANAPITIVEYTDFQCPYCARGHAVMKQILKKYGNKVRLITKNLPLENIHPMAMPAAKRYEALALQNPKKASRFHDIAFENQQKMKDEKDLDAFARKAGANMARLKKDMNSDKVESRIEADMAEAEKFGFQGTPAFIVEGVALAGAYPKPYFEKIIDRKLAEKKK